MVDVKKVLSGWILLLLAAFLLVAAFVTNFWAPSHAERVPLDTDSTTYLSGEADKLNAATGVVEHMPVKVYSLTRVDPKKSDDKVVVWVQSTCVNNNTDNPPDCLPDDDPRLITDTIEEFATDRHTGLAVNNSAYVKTDVTYSGLLNKFPFNTEKKNYSFWDSTMGGVTAAKYVGTESMGGVEVYRFDMQITDAPISLGEGIDGIYNLTKSVWVEPRTGAIIDQKQHDVRTQTNGDPALDMTIAFTPTTVKGYIQDAKDNIAQLKLIETTIPLIGFIGGSLCLIAGVWLMFSARGRRGSGAGDRLRVAA